MSEKEQLLQLIEKVPNYKIGYVLAFVKGLLACWFLWKLCTWIINYNITL